MRTKYKQAPPYPEASLSGTVLTIEDQEYDLAEMQQDSERIENIRDYRGRFLANIIIPPMVYEEVDTGETDEEGNAVYEQQPQPLNVEKVRLVLWQKRPKKQTEEEVA